MHGLLLVDKARGPTSHDVVAVVRRVLGTREVGHTGTLDPMATGVLVLVVGEATKLVNLLGASDKRYEATLALGVHTRTLDAEGETILEADVPELTLEQVQTAAQRFVGEIDQRVPEVSAVKVEGQPLHKLSRKGQEVVAPIKRVTTYSIDVRAVRKREIDFAVHSGKGFYVRAFGRDLSEALGTVGHLSALRRVQNGRFRADDSLDFEELRAALRAGEAEKRAVMDRVIPLGQVALELPHGTLSAEGVTNARHGRAISLDCFTTSSPESVVVGLDEAGAPVAILERSGDALRVLRGFRA